MYLHRGRHRAFRCIFFAVLVPRSFSNFPPAKKDAAAIAWPGCGIKRSLNPEEDFPFFPDLVGYPKFGGG